MVGKEGRKDRDFACGNFGTSNAAGRIQNFFGWMRQTRTGFQHFPSDGMRFLRARGHPVSERVLVFDLPVVLILFLSFPIRAPDYDMESAYQTGIALILDLSQQFFFDFLSKSDEVRI